MGRPERRVPEVHDELPPRSQYQADAVSCFGVARRAPRRAMHGARDAQRDGSWVSTPVNLVVDGDQVDFRTWSRAGKAKRLRNFPEVRFAASDWRGRAHGPQLCGTARLLAGSEDRRVGALINKRYPLLQGVAVRFGHKLMRYQTQHYAVGDIASC